MQLTNRQMQRDCLLGAAPAPEGSAHTDGWSWSAWEQWPEQESLFSPVFHSGQEVK